MSFKNLLRICLFACLLSLCLCCSGGSGGKGGDAKGDNSRGGDGGDGGFGKKRNLAVKGRIAIAFNTFDDDRDGQISLKEFLKFRPGVVHLFHLADTDDNSVLTCPEFSQAVSKFGGKAIC